jgi:thermostable 8-oxoguanine DNA glycosylase
MINSIGELIDKLIIENVKIANIREKLNRTPEHLVDQEYVELENKMQVLNENRGIIIGFLDQKIEAVKRGEPNKHLKHIKTYYGS